MKSLRQHAAIHCGTIAILIAAVTACSRGADPAAAAPASATSAPAAAAATPDHPIPDTASPLDALPESVRLVMDQPFTDDFDAMVKRRAIRVAVTFNRTHYFIDKGQERGLTYESLKLFENDLNVSPRSGSAGKRSPMSATSTSTTSPTA